MHTAFLAKQMTRNLGGARIYRIMLKIVYTQARIGKDWMSLILVDNTKLVPYKDATGAPDEIVIQTAADMARALGTSSF